MRINKNMFAPLLAAVLFLFVGIVSSASAQDMKSNPDEPKMDDKRPIVAIIRADWCPYCKDLEPKLAKLMEQYGENLKFVVFDITNRETTEKARSASKLIGLLEFFDANKTKASLVAIFKDKKQVFSTLHNTDRADFAKAFEAAVKQ